MNTVNVADLRNHFRRVSAWLENGESVKFLGEEIPTPFFLLYLKIRTPNLSRLILLLSVRQFGEVGGLVLGRSQR